MKNINGIKSEEMVKKSLKDKEEGTGYISAATVTSSVVGTNASNVIQNVAVVSTPLQLETDELYADQSNVSCSQEICKEKENMKISPDSIILGPYSSSRTVLSPASQMLNRKLFVNDPRTKHTKSEDVSNAICKSPGFDEECDHSNYLEQLNVTAGEEGTEVSILNTGQSCGIVEHDAQDILQKVTMGSIASSNVQRISEESSFEQPKNTKNSLPLLNFTRKMIPFFHKAADDDDDVFGKRNQTQDIVSTPPRNVITKNSILSCANDVVPTSFCGNNHLHTPDRSVRSIPQGITSCGPVCGTDFCGAVLEFAKQDKVEQKIGDLLGSEGNWCEGWHVWGLPIENKEDQTSLSPVMVQRAFRNRAGNLSRKMNRIRSLQQNMSPFEDIDLQEINLHSIKRVSSIDLTDNIDSAINTSTCSDASSSLQSLNGFLSLGSCAKSSEEMASSSSREEEDLCYDSDPGTATYRQRNRIYIRRDYEGMIDGPPIHLSSSERRIRTRQNHRIRPKIASQIPPLRKFIYNDVDRFDINDSSAVSSVVQDTLNRSMTLVWHPTVDKSGKPRAPLSIIAWIERGQQLPTTLIQPKILWKEKHGRRTDSSRKEFFNRNVHSVDLLDISHIFEVKEVDRKIHPLARASTSFILEYFDSQALFEASCKSERDRIVLSLKLTVARLGSKIIVNDNTFFEEFFHISLPNDATPNW